MNHYSQNDEQEVIQDYFRGCVGNLLEVGAFDGITFSNTRALLEAGWSGILVEPDPLNFYKLMEASKPFVGRVTLIPCAVGRGGGFARLLMDTTHDRGWASTITERCSRGVLIPSEVRIFVPVLGVADVGSGFDFINIDAEGMDFDILKAIPAETFRACRLLCVEPYDLDEREKMRGFLLGAGFRTHHETPENLIVVRQ